MSEYIKREDAWELTAILHSEYLTKEQEQMLERLDEAIDQLSGIEVVRCKDCIHARRAYCSLLDRTIESDGSGYCYFAERKSEEREHE